MVNITKILRYHRYCGKHFIFYYFFKLINGLVMIFHKSRLIFIGTYIKKSYKNSLSTTSSVSSEIFSMQELPFRKLVARFLLCWAILMIWLVMSCLLSKQELGQFSKIQPWMGGCRNLSKIQFLIAEMVADSQV